MASAQTSPTPLFDTLENLERPLAAVTFDVSKYFKDTIIAGAELDYRYANEFLYSYRGSAATFNAYRRELERLLHWSWFIAKKTLKAITRADFEAFVEFCQSPPLQWIGVKNVSRFIEKNGKRIPNPEWRPFVVPISKVAYRKGEERDPKRYVLSQKALQAIFSICSSFYNYLIQEDYIDANPIAQIRQKSKFIRKQQSQSTIRRLTELQWAYVIETAELMAQEDPDEHERTLFIMNALYAMYLRISELAESERWQPKMGDFHMDTDGNWWFRTVGKGNKERIITVSNAMLNALKRYRNFLNLTPLPYPGEMTPLLIRTRGRGAISSTRQIRAIVQHCFDKAINRMHEDGFKEDAERLMAATVHWLRHTGISDDVRHRPREHVRDDAGHGSSAITDKYIDVELRARHASAKHKRIKPDE